MFCVSRSKKKKKHDILFPEEVVVKEEPGLEKPREKVCALSFCPSQSFGRLLMLEYPYTTTMILANVDEMRRRSEEKEVGMARGGEMTERGGGGRRGGEGWTFLPVEWLLILFFRDERDDKYARDRHRDRDEREDRYREDRYAREDRGRDEKQV